MIRKLTDLIYYPTAFNAMPKTVGHYECLASVRHNKSFIAAKVPMMVT